MEKPLISIAMCTYNGEKFLSEQLDSIVNQTYKNIEIIIVDDQSKDGTIEILEQYAQQHPNIKIYKNKANLGYIKNFEKAIGLCSGEFIALCDQDDIWHLDKIEIQLQEIGKNVLVYHDSEFVDNQGISLNKRLSDVVNMYDGSSCRPFLFFNCVSGHTMFFKKELFVASCPFPKHLFHDHWMAYVSGNIGTIKYVNQPLVKYRQHENSDTNILKLTRSKNRKTIFGKDKLLKALRELEVFADFKLNKEQKFLNDTLRLYRTRLNNYLCFGLVIFIYSHFKSLLFISKKSTVSKLNYIYKHIWGIKIKSS